MAESVDAPDLKSVGHYARGSSSLPTRIILNILRYLGVSMKYQLHTKYCWLNNKKQIVLMYFIQNFPFTFDDLPEFAYHDAEVMEVANIGPSYEMEDLYRASMYLIDEECHPMLFELELENPELLPID
jgi:hypothetical protein|tara:strand:+ start:169 stop:552 length:384 start_codon:yes stop_codon:yes gene_type:complete